MELGNGSETGNERGNRAESQGAGGRGVRELTGLSTIGRGRSRRGATTYRR